MFRYRNVSCLTTNLACNITGIKTFLSCETAIKNFKIAFQVEKIKLFHHVV